MQIGCASGSPSSKLSRLGHWSQDDPRLNRARTTLHFSSRWAKLSGAEPDMLMETKGWKIPPKHFELYGSFEKAWQRYSLASIIVAYQNSYYRRLHLYHQKIQLTGQTHGKPLRWRRPGKLSRWAETERNQILGGGCMEAWVNHWNWIMNMIYI